ncbi:ankyrin repeat protein, partial [Phaeosphaeriaceae sp. PMI808]
DADCLRSLSFPEQEQRYKRIELTKDTCQWLLEDPEYRAWMKKSRGLFWIKGNPGAGKSVIMKFAVTEMHRRQSGELVLSFFVHGQGTDLQKTPLGIYRTLLNTMLKYFPEYLSQLTKLFEDQEERFGAYTENRWKWIDKELQDFLSVILTKGSKRQPVVIFIDALDECGEGVAKSLLRYFKDLMEVADIEESQVKICVSSRHYPILGIDTIPTTSVEKRNCKDLQLVIQRQLEEIEPDWRRNQIQKAILSKAQGGFQWAILVTNLVIDSNAIGTRVEELHKIITSMPQALDELYTNILSGFTEAEEHMMVKLFQWVLFAERPLSMQELRDALATDQDMTCITISELRRNTSWTETLDQFERHAKHISRGLVEFRTRDLYEQYELDGEESDKEAQFIHQSVADYLLERFFKNIGRHQCDSRSYAGAGHFEVSRSCLRYLALKEVLEATQLPRSTISARFPLVPYATRFVFDHIRKAEQHGISQADLLMLFQWDAQSESLGKVARIWTVFDPNSVHTPLGWPFIGTTALHFLIALGSKSALDACLLERDIDVSRKDSNGDTPLLLATRGSQQDMALALLRRT